MKVHFTEMFAWLKSLLVIKNSDIFGVHINVRDYLQTYSGAFNDTEAYYNKSTSALFSFSC